MNERSTVRTREMGVELKARRELQELPLREIARRAGWSASRVSSWENGRRVSAVDAAIYLALCDTNAPERTRLLELTQPPNELYWVRPHFDKLVDAAKSLTIQESLATSMLYHSPTAVPAMLQTEDYVRALYEVTARHTPHRLKQLVQARLDRQQLLHGEDAPASTFFIHERALRSVVRDTALMYEQLQYLVLMASAPRCTIRILPVSAVPHHLMGNRFTVLEFDDHPAVVYEETFSASLFIEDRLAVEAVYIYLARLEQLALSPGESREMLIKVTADYDRMTS